MLEGSGSYLQTLEGTSTGKKYIDIRGRTQITLKALLIEKNYVVL